MQKKGVVLIFALDIIINADLDMAASEDECRETCARFAHTLVDEKRVLAVRLRPGTILLARIKDEDASFDGPAPTVQ